MKRQTTVLINLFLILMFEFVLCSYITSRSEASSVQENDNPKTEMSLLV